MPLSTSKPSAITRAAIEICCRAKPLISRAPMAIIIDNGITTMMMVEERKPRKRNITTPTSNTPCIRLAKKSLILAFTAGACSNAVTIFTSCGKVSLNEVVTCSISSESLIRFTPSFWVTVIQIAFSPIYLARQRLSA